MNADAIITEFRSRQETKNSDSTAYRYSRNVKEFSEWLAEPGSKDYDPNARDRPSKELWEATTADLRVFLRHQLNSGLAGGTVRKRRWALATFYRELEEMVEEGYGIPEFKNPSEDLDVSNWQPLKGESKKQQELKGIYYLKPKEVDKLAENATSPTLRNELIIRLLFHTGLRRGELAQTRLEDVDTDERAIKVHATKTHLNRTVYYQSSLDVLMNRWINVERKSLVTAGSEYLFPTYKTNRISPEQINRTVRKAADAAGLQAHVYTNAAGHNQMKVTAHVLRHSYAVQCVENQMHIRHLQILMGHAKIETTEQYLRLGKSDIRDAARKYGAGTE